MRPAQDGKLFETDKSSIAALSIESEKNSTACSAVRHTCWLKLKI